MAIEARYTAPLQIVETAQMRDRVRAIAEAEKISQADVMRDLLRHGIEWREEVSRERLEGLFPAE